jgi:hypothetical protein
MKVMAMDGRALEISGLAVRDGVLTYKVSRCAYLERYQEMGLPLELGYAMSCARDGAFAWGYHAGLTMERPSCIGQGGSGCEFRFIWS